MSTNLTRRAVLRGSAVAVAAAAITLPVAAAAALPDPDPVLDAWRAWRPLEEEAARLIVERDRIWQSLPKEATAPVVVVTRPGIGHDLTMPSIHRYDAWTRLFEEVKKSAGENPEQPSFSTANWMRGYRRNFVRRFRRAEAKAQALKDESGWTAVCARIEATFDRATPHEIAIMEATATSPAAIAAQLDLGLAHAKQTDGLADLPHCMACRVISSLIHQLPADMAATLEPIAAERGKIRDVYLQGARS